MDGGSNVHALIRFSVMSNNPKPFDEDKVLTLADIKPLFGEKTDPNKTDAQSDDTVEAPSKPTNLSQHIYDKLHPYFSDLLQKLTGTTIPLSLDADFYVKLAEAIRVQQWNDTCSIKLWILINNLKSPLAKHTGNKWADLYKTANDIYKKIRSERRASEDINSFTCPRGQWIDYNDKAKPRPSVENCIVALQFILEDDKAELKYDTWKRTVVVVWTPRPESLDIY